MQSLELSCEVNKWENITFEAPQKDNLRIRQCPKLSKKATLTELFGKNTKTTKCLSKLLGWIVSNLHERVSLWYVALHITTDLPVRETLHSNARIGFLPAARSGGRSRSHFVTQSVSQSSKPKWATWRVRMLKVLKAKMLVTWIEVDWPIQMTTRWHHHWENDKKVQKISGYVSGYVSGCVT